MQKQGLRKNSKSYKSLLVIIFFIVSITTPTWFEVKCKPNIYRIPHHMVTYFKLFSKHCSHLMKAVVALVMEREACYAHPENILLAMFALQG